MKERVLPPVYDVSALVPRQRLLVLQAMAVPDTIPGQSGRPDQRVLRVSLARHAVLGVALANVKERLCQYPIILCEGEVVNLADARALHWSDGVSVDEVVEATWPRRYDHRLTRRRLRQMLRYAISEACSRKGWEVAEVTLDAGGELLTLREEG